MRERKEKRKGGGEGYPRCRSLTLPSLSSDLMHPTLVPIHEGKEIIIQGVDNENYAEDGWFNGNSFPLCEHRPFLSTKRSFETSISRYRSREHPSHRKNPIPSDWGYVSS